MIRNSGIVGPPSVASLTKASGVYDTFDVFNGKKLSSWPVVPKYISITPSSPISYNEGSAVTITVNTVDVTNGTVLYYTILQVGGTITAGDFTDATLSGSFTITSNTGTFTKTLFADGTSEAGDAFQVQIRTGSISGTIVLTSATITINNPVFTLSMVSASYNEGTAPTFQFSSTNWNTQTLYWRTSAASDDTSTGSTSGTFSYTSGGTSTVSPYTLKLDMVSEGNETHTISVYDSTNVYLLASTTYTAVDTSTAPTFSISPSTSINEGDTVTFTVTFPGMSSGTIYWTTSGTSIASDFVDNTLTGTATISSGTATITRTLRKDFLTDGSKTLIMNLYRDGANTFLVASSSTVTVADTCQLPTISASSTSINEGDTVTFTITTIGVTDGTVLPYNMNLVSGSYIGTWDFTDTLLSGTVTINSNTGTITKTWANDGYTEGTQSYSLSLAVPTSDTNFIGTRIATSPTITVADTSTGTVPPSLYSFSAFTFTNASATGVNGPTLANCLATYNTTTYPWLNSTNYFNVTSGIQYWTVPISGSYRIAARGGNGSPASGAAAGATGGKGIIVTADVTLDQGEIIRILVGQEGLRTSSNGGGGGGTFVVRTPYNTTASILVIAGGGGGRRTSSSGVGIDGASYATYSGYGTSNNTNSAASVGIITVNGPAGISGFTNPSNLSGGGVTLGYGGASADGNYGDSGAGFFGNGRDDGTGTSNVATAFINATNPGRGGISTDGSSGGFGCGGGGAGGNGGGGGGGYTGGNGGHTAGGGGSYVISGATNVSYTTDANATGISTSGFHGYCTITKL